MVANLLSPGALLVLTRDSGGAGPTPEAVFRGARDRDGTPVADVLQCGLDVVSNPARGDEMAEHLYAGVIRPSLIERDQ